MIRTILMLAFWAFLLPIAAVICFPWVFITGDIRPLYRVGMWAAFAGVRLAGVKVETIGINKLDRKTTYLFMSNHVSNIDPPLLLPLIPGRVSVMAKKELFSIPILGKAMRMASLVPVDRGNREAGIAAVRAAAEVVKQGIHMTIFVEGHVARMMQIWDDIAAAGDHAAAASAHATKTQALHGPPLDGDSGHASQAEVDKLFAHG